MIGVYKLFVLFYWGSVGKNRETPSPALRRTTSSTGISSQVPTGSWITAESSRIFNSSGNRLAAIRQGKLCEGRLGTLQGGIKFSGKVEQSLPGTMA